MLQIPVAKVAVLAATFAFDRPYTYKIPQPLTDTRRPGMPRASCRFRRGNRPLRGAWRSRSIRRRTRPRKAQGRITRQLDPEPVLSDRQLRLAVVHPGPLFLHLSMMPLHAILPAGALVSRRRRPTVYCRERRRLDAAPRRSRCAGRSKQRRLALEDYVLLRTRGSLPVWSSAADGQFGDNDPASAAALACGAESF